jgi:hypothetical protein
MAYSGKTMTPILGFRNELLLYLIEERHNSAHLCIDCDFGM